MPPLREIDPKAEQKTGRIKIKSSTPGKSLLQGEKQAGSQEKRGNMSRKSLKKNTNRWGKKLPCWGKVHKYNLTKEGNVAGVYAGTNEGEQKGGKVWKVGVSGLKWHVSQFMITGK